MSMWYVAINSQRQGPMNEAALQELMAAQGQTRGEREGSARGQARSSARGQARSEQKLAN